MSTYIVPLIALAIVVTGWIRRVPVFDCFVQGAKQGGIHALNLIPTLVGLWMAVSALRAGGVIDMLTTWLSPITTYIGLPSELIPLAVLRPFSGSGSLALLSDILTQHGADSAIGLYASVLQASTETTFYTLTVYYGHIHITRTRHTLAAATVGDMAGVLFAVLAVRYLLLL